jgi:iron complex outermembrane receptor protein
MKLKLTLLLMVCTLKGFSQNETPQLQADTIQSQELQTVEITGRLKKDYNSEYSFGATKIAARTKDIPQAIGSVTKELILDRQAFQLSDAVKIL